MAETQPGAVVVDGYNPYGPNAQADDTRQAQQTNSNDTPTDVNINAVVVRSQALTFDLMGKNFEANAMRFNGIMNQAAAKAAGAP